MFRMHQKHIVDFTPGRSHVEPARRGKGHKGRPRSGWLQQLGEHDQLVQWLKPLTCPPWMEKAQFGHLPDHLEVRELRYQVHRKGFRVTSITLVTTLLEVDLYPADALAELSHRRWQVETNLRHRKQTMGLDGLHWQRLAGVMKELTVFALVSNLVRVVRLEAAQR